jgi:hypothetical protein
MKVIGSIIAWLGSKRLPYEICCRSMGHPWSAWESRSFGRMFSRRSPQLMRWWIAPANSTRSWRGIAPESQADQKVKTMV